MVMQMFITAPKIHQPIMKLTEKLIKQKVTGQIYKLKINKKSYLGQYSINKLLINHKPRKTTIGDKSIPPKVGKYLLTKFKIGSHNRRVTSMML